MTVNTICREEEIGEVLERGLPIAITRFGPAVQWRGSGA